MAVLMVQTMVVGRVARGVGSWGHVKVFRMAAKMAFRKVVNEIVRKVEKMVELMVHRTVVLKVEKRVVRKD